MTWTDPHATELDLAAIGACRVGAWPIAMEMVPRDANVSQERKPKRKPKARQRETLNLKG